MNYDPDQGEDETAATDHRYAPQDPDLDDLTAAFEDWQTHLTGDEYALPSEHELYEAAEQALADVGTVTADQVNAVAATYADAAHAPLFGVFMSAAYDHAEEDEIVQTMSFDDDPPQHLGYELPADRTLVLEEPVDDLGHNAEGRIVVRTDMEDHGFATFCYADVVNEASVEMLAPGSTGIVVNDGEADFMYPATTGIAVNRGQVRRIANMDSGITINTGSVEDPVPQRQQDGQEGIEHLAPVGLTINYGDATPAVAGGVVIDAADDPATVYHAGEVLLTEDEVPDAELWDEVDGIEGLVESGDGGSVIDALEQYADGLELEDRFTADHDGDEEVPKDRFRIGGRIERLLDAALAE